MANLAQFDIGAKQHEARIRALLEDLTGAYIGVRPESRLALAVWFARSLGSGEQYMLFIYSGVPINAIASDAVPLYWKSGIHGSPLVHIDWTDVDWFSTLLKHHPGRVARYHTDYEVLYFDKSLLHPDILDTFQVITEPPGLMKGWYVDEEEYRKSKSIADLFSTHRSFKPDFGLVKSEEKDYEHCRGILHLETSQRWLPISADGIRVYTYYTDHQKNHKVYFLFEGGALYEVLRFEVKTAPDYVDKLGLLGKTRDDRYPEVYLRAVRPTAQSTA